METSGAYPGHCPGPVVHAGTNTTTLADLFQMLGGEWEVYGRRFFKKPNGVSDPIANMRIKIPLQ